MMNLKDISTAAAATNAATNNQIHDNQGGGTGKNGIEDLLAAAAAAATTASTAATNNDQRSIMLVEESVGGRQGSAGKNGIEGLPAATAAAAATATAASNNQIHHARRGVGGGRQGNAEHQQKGTSGDLIPAAAAAAATNNHQAAALATLSPFPRDLYTLWDEYICMGSNGRKAARHTSLWPRKIVFGKTFSRSKIVWETIVERLVLIRRLSTNVDAIDRIYDVYGAGGGRNSTILLLLRPESTVYARRQEKQRPSLHCCCEKLLSLCFGMLLLCRQQNLLKRGMQCTLISHILGDCEIGNLKYRINPFVISDQSDSTNSTITKDVQGAG
eukprot:scaffold596_cov87-Cylindrotheca_fusiformis.AAC.6